MKKTITILGFIAFIAVFNTKLNAQVTIGTNREPVAGAILELSNAESDGDNSTKGMILPRVIIEDRNEMTIGKTGASVSYDPDEHIGLLVYNIGQSFHKCKSETLQQGPFVWNGNEWEAAGDFEKEKVDLSFAKGVGILTDDRDPDNVEHYLYGTFGNDLWMLENMRANRYAGPRLATEIDVDIERDPRAANTVGSDAELVSYTWIYPTRDSDGKNPDNFLKNKSLGYLYTLYSATRTGPPTNGVTTYNVRGICPKGWTIPTEQNVIDLETELMNNYDKYSDWPEKPSDASYVIAPVCKMTGTAADNETGSLIREKGGFYFQYPGFRGNDGLDHRNYGVQGGFWLSEQNGTNNDGRRYTTDGRTIPANSIAQQCYYSVRCVKVGGATP